LTDVGFCIAYRACRRTTRDVTGARVILASWLADISVPLRCAIVTLSLLCNTSLTNSSQALIAVSIDCALIGNKFTRVGVRVAEVGNLTVTISFTATSVVLVADRFRIFTIETIIMATWTTAK